MLDAECDEDCDLNCVVTVSENGRKAAYDSFCGVATDARVAQNLYLLRSCVVFKYQTVDTDIIEQTVEFWLGDEIKIEVCKTFFARTLGLPDARLDALFEPETLEWFSRYCKSDDEATIDDYGEQQPLATIFDNEQLCSEDLIKEPFKKVPGWDSTRAIWTTLNRIRSEQGRCNYLLHKWGMVDSPLCECGEMQTIKHMVESCPITMFKEGLTKLHEGGPTAIKWLEELNIRL
ncbi:Hypothetical protein CINCED_3A001511 [Cinara cedri]|uniref:Uncharacterized protein n=1 Tax=Cinara cedri TaxID=506608 RepID=A0A5E4MT17_9HEMI|nr:Hypothetical protein CINCED_3A001511 [Cinara cedri]